MPPSKRKPAEIASEVKHIYTDHVKTNYAQEWPQSSILYPDSAQIRCKPTSTLRSCTIQLHEGDPIDIALGWAGTSGRSIPVVVPCHEKRPGGDWESGIYAPEECLSRRSTLHASLTKAHPDSPYESHYPIPVRGGIYSPNVVVFRDGPEHYKVWNHYKTLPVICVPPVKRPKISSSSGRYSFKEEEELMCDKIRTILRIAVYEGHTNLVAPAWGCGPQFRNPPAEVAQMWIDILFHEQEFAGQFGTIVFAFDTADGPTSSGINPSSSSSSKGSSKSSPTSSASKGTAREDYEVFRHVMRARLV